MRAILSVIAAASTLLAGTSLAQQPKQAKLRAALKAQLLQHLKDPESAKLYGEALYLAEDGTTVALCGEVNARTSFGGYAGRTGFISTSAGLVIFQDSPGSAEFGAVWRVWCVKRA